MRIIHSDDWQIGKVFKQFGAKEEMLRQARFDSAQKSRYHDPNDLPTKIPTKLAGYQQKWANRREAENATCACFY